VPYLNEEDKNNEDRSALRNTIKGVAAQKKASEDKPEKNLRAKKPAKFLTNKIPVVSL
jgi:hypothetical protein